MYRDCSVPQGLEHRFVGVDVDVLEEDDVDSGVTFDEDSGKEIDTIEIEEEDWIDYIERSTADARWNVLRFDAGTEHTKR